MKPSFIVTAVALLARGVFGHTVFTHFHGTTGGGDTSCVRRPPNTNPITDLASAAMACNVGADNGGASGKCTVRAGDSVGFEWRTDSRVPAKDYPLKNTPKGPTPIGVVDDSHKGPCAVYMKKVDNAANAQGSGSGWFKIYESTLVDGVFCTDILRLSNALERCTIPKTIANGDYLLRAELLTLNNAGSYAIGGQEEPQFYVGCAQITVTGGTGTGNAATVSIPGYVNKKTPGMIFDIWNSPSGKFSGYPSFGPPVFVDAAGGVVQATTTTAPAPATTSSVVAPAPAPTTTSEVPPAPAPTSVTVTTSVVPTAGAPTPSVEPTIPDTPTDGRPRGKGKGKPWWSKEHTGRRSMPRRV
ncbi:putative endo-beta-1,4-glucanase D [Peziza echinospora]|nr:putative endo-beta-1,4-glucanase D [Peziza echinospora]